MFRQPCLAIGFVVLPTLVFATSAGMAGESFETTPVRPEGGDYVPPPFVAVKTEPAGALCGKQHYDLAGPVPLPVVNGHPVLTRGVWTLDGQPLAPPSLKWTLTTPAVAIADRTWTQGAVRLTLKQTVEYDGFITCDLTLAPAENAAAVRELSLQLIYCPERSAIYHIPANSTTPAGLWPAKAEIDQLIPGVWGGDETGGLACYIGSQRSWRGPSPRIVLSRDQTGSGQILYRLVAEPLAISAPVTFRLGFIATPVRDPETRHWQLYSVANGPSDLQRYVTRNRIWTAMSDRYATFSTNDPKRDAQKNALIAEIHDQGKTALAYTTYDHVEEGAVEVAPVWLMLSAKGKPQVSPISPRDPNSRRVFCCPGSREWVKWKIADLQAAIDRYKVDGFYVDTSYVIMGCSNGEHDHGWVDNQGQRQVDFPVWSQREIWRRAYEMLYQQRGHAEIYAHHKGGCTAALAAFTTAFCDGEQYTSQPMKNLTLDGFRAQIAGRNMGPLGLFLCEYYRTQSVGRPEKAGHHNPAECLMYCLVHGILPTGYPGEHPVRELLSLADDLQLFDATWTPYYAPDLPWKTSGAEGLAVSAYRTARGDTLLVVANPTYTDVQCALTGPTDATADRTFVIIDLLARLGRHTPFTPGYRWEKGDPARLSIGARSVGVFAWIRQPESLAAFAHQHGFASSDAQHARRTPVPEDATLLDDFEEPDWTLASDEGSLSPTGRDPVDTKSAIRVQPRPKHNAAAIMLRFDISQDWSTCKGLSFWIRPDKDFPVRAFDLRLSNGGRYSAGSFLVSHRPADMLPAGKWTQVKYDFGKTPRQNVDILRLYFHRGELCSGSFDIDEMLLLGGHPCAASASKTKTSPHNPRKPGAVDRPGAAPE
jgi:hypothetical protein